MKAGDPLPVDVSKLPASTFVGCVITSPLSRRSSRQPDAGDVRPRPAPTCTMRCKARCSISAGARRIEVTAMFRNIDAISESARYDIIVIGSGAAGMAAALFAAIEGRKVLVVERTEYVGGTSALSAATTWMPNSHHSKTVNPDDSREKVPTIPRRRGRQPFSGGDARGFSRQRARGGRNARGQQRGQVPSLRDPSRLRAAVRRRDHARPCAGAPAV